MKGMKRKLTSAKTANDPDSRINKSLRAWNCKEGGAVRGGGCEIRGKTKGKIVCTKKVSDILELWTAKVDLLYL
jgi:hypothetical protein